MWYQGKKGKGLIELFPTGEYSWLNQRVDITPSTRVKGSKLKCGITGGYITPFSKGEVI